MRSCTALVTESSWGREKLVEMIPHMVLVEEGFE
jgi:hypothetical protein